MVKSQLWRWHLYGLYWTILAPRAFCHPLPLVDTDSRTSPTHRFGVGHCSSGRFTDTDMAYKCERQRSEATAAARAGCEAMWLSSTTSLEATVEVGRTNDGIRSTFNYGKHKSKNHDRLGRIHNDGKGVLHCNQIRGLTDCGSRA